MAQSVLDKRLILVAGKGGVGRSTVAASMALAAARRGRRTLLVEANANDRFGSYFNAPPVGPQIVRLRENLHAVNTNPAAALEEYGMMVLRFRRVYRMVFENRVTKYFLRAIPGLDDYSIIGKVWFHTTEERRGKPVWDTVVFDLPASGHSLSMLRIAWVILDTIPDGPLTRDARKLATLLKDKTRTAMTMVTLAEEMPANEARELTAALSSELDIGVDHLFINQVYPDRFPTGSPQVAVLDAALGSVAPEPETSGAGAAISAPPSINHVASHAELVRSRRALNERYIAQLAGDIAAPQSQLPRLFVPSLSNRDIESLSRLIEKQLT